MGAAPPRSSERRSGVGLELTACDHVLKSRCDLRVISVEHIKYLMQLPPPPVDLVDEIAHRECTHKDGEVIRPPLRHPLPPASWLLADLARLVVQDDFDRARQSFAAEVGANFRFEIG